MEHRCGSRHPLRAIVLLRAPGREPVRAITREVSISGMFVEAPQEYFCGNSVIEIEATVPGATGLRTYRWQAMVVRKTETGLGLMFDRLRPPAVSRLIATVEAGLAVASWASRVPAPRPERNPVAPRH